MRLIDVLETMDIKFGAAAAAGVTWLVYSFRLGHRIGLLEEQVRQQGKQLEHLIHRFDAHFDKGGA